MTTTLDDPRKARIARQLGAIRSRTFAMVDPLTPDDLHKQHVSIMSPVVWDMGHVANFEELWLLREVDGRQPHDVTLDDLYNPFDNPRWCRGDLQILNEDEATDYLNEVRGDTLSILAKADLDGDDPLAKNGYVFDMTIQHEAQHQETILQALDLRPDLAPYELASTPYRPPARTVDDEEQVLIPAGDFNMGTDDRSAAYDNERPMHRVWVDSFRIDRYPTSSRRYAAFVGAGGYRRREFWSDEGWAWRQEVDAEAPQGWLPAVGGGWLIKRFGHVFDLDPAEPVEHINFHEAQAFAAYAGGRLPTEAEWEKAAGWDPVTNHQRTYPWGEQRPSAEHANLDHRGWGPAPVGSYPGGASSYGVEQMLGDGYEWTSSFFTAYPGYSTFPYPEYSEVFFDGEYRVLRGASWATSQSVARNSFRNWDNPIRRQIFAGVRLAWNVA